VISLILNRPTGLLLTVKLPGRHARIEVLRIVTNLGDRMKRDAGCPLLFDQHVAFVQLPSNPWRLPVISALLRSTKGSLVEFKNREPRKLQQRQSRLSQFGKSPLKPVLAGHSDGQSLAVSPC
jgi:hypothetical protein